MEGYARIGTLYLLREPIGPILPPSDEIVIENGIEFVKSNSIDRPHEEEKNDFLTLSINYVIISM